MPDYAKHTKVHAAGRLPGAPLGLPMDGDLTCSESQIEDILSEGESSRPMSKSDKGLHPKRQPKSSQ
jgi:hypothetical protein